MERNKELEKIKDSKNCAFQYFDGDGMACDEFGLSLIQAKSLWNKYYDDMVDKTNEGKEIEVAIWINMVDDKYEETLIHLSAPKVHKGNLCETKYYGPI